MKNLLLILVLTILVAGCSRKPGPTLDPRILDRDTSVALRAALMGRPDHVQSAARLMLSRGDGEEYKRASSAATILATSTARPIPAAGEARRVYPPASRTQAVRIWRLTKNRVNPADRWLEARADRRYDRFQRTTDAVLAPLANAAQGQFFSLLSLPFAAADWVIVGRVYLTPEQRKELQEARRIAANPQLDEPEADEFLETWRDRRRKLGALQAARNGDDALAKGELSTALFWYSRATGLLPENRRYVEKFDKARQRQSEERLARRASLSMAQADAAFSTRAELAAYGNLLRVYLLKEERDKFSADARAFRARMPWSHLLPVLDAAIAGTHRNEGIPRLAASWLATIETDTPWGERAAALLLRPELDPVPTLETAQGDIDRRFHDFIVKGTNPYRPPRSRTAEEARLDRTIWVDRARALFITDILSRILFLPFLDPMPRRELLDAAAVIDDPWFDRPEAQPWLARIARAREVERRHDAAVRTWERLGNERRARRAANAAGHHLERLARSAATPREAAAIYQRLINAWPQYRHIERVRIEHARAEIRSQAVAVIPRALIKSYPDFLSPGILDLSPRLVDGQRRNGEIAREGVWLLPWGGIVYQDEDTRRDIERTLPAGNIDNALALLIERRRLASDHVEVRKPLPRRRIPLEVEAGIFPGFDVSPGLVPLSPAQRERELFE